MTTDKWVNRWYVPSSRGGGNHTVSQDKDGNWACSCIGWTRHMPRTDCKHIREVKEGGGQSLSDAVLDRLSD